MKLIESYGPNPRVVRMFSEEKIDLMQEESAGGRPSATASIHLLSRELGWAS